MLARQETGEENTSRASSPSQRPRRASHRQSALRSTVWMSTPPTSKMTALITGARSPAIDSGAVSTLALRLQAYRASIHPDAKPATRLWSERATRPRAHEFARPFDVPAVNGDRASVHLRVQHSVGALW